MPPDASAPPTPAALKLRLKELIIATCDLDGITPEDIGDDERLIRGGGRFDLNSLDAIEIAAAIEREFSVRIEDLSAAKAVFRTVSSLAAHIGRSRGWAP